MTQIWYLYINICILTQMMEASKTASVEISTAPIDRSGFKSQTIKLPRETIKGI